MTLEEMYAFLLVTLYPALGVEELAKLAGVEQSVMLGHLRNISPTKRPRAPGLVNLTKDRQTDKEIYELTPRGAWLARQLHETLQ